MKIFEGIETGFQLPLHNQGSQFSLDSFLPFGPHEDEANRGIICRALSYFWPMTVSKYDKARNSTGVLPGIWTPPLSHTNSEIINLRVWYSVCVRLHRNSIMELTAYCGPVKSKRPLFHIPRCASCPSLLGWKHSPQNAFHLGLPVSRHWCTLLSTEIYEKSETTVVIIQLKVSSNYKF